MSDLIKLTTIDDVVIPMSITKDNALHLSQDNALKGEKGDPFLYEDFTPEQLESLRGPQGFQGEKGNPFTYADFTAEQLELLRGPQGIQGIKGDPFIYEDFTSEQLESLRGPQGEPGKDGAGVTILGKYNTSEELDTAHTTGKLGDAYLVNENLYIWNGTIWQDVGPIRGPQGPRGEKGLQGIQGVQGEKGDPFLYEDFTPEQLESLRGPQGFQGVQGPIGSTGPQGEPFTYEDLTQAQIDELAHLVADKAQDIDLTPYAKTVDVNAQFSSYYNKTEVNNLVDTIPKFTVQLVSSLPTADISPTTIYLVPNVEDSGSAENISIEYIYINGRWEIIGSTAIDHSVFALKTDIPTQEISSLVSHAQNSAIHVTAADKDLWTNKADKATTLSGYKILDAYTKTEVDSLLGNISIDTSSLVDIASAQTITGAKTFNSNVQVNGSITATGPITGNKVYNSVWNDYAEWFEKEDINEVFETGDIVSWNDSGVKLSDTEYDNMVIGVVSNTYGCILGGEALEDMEQNRDRFVPIGLKGRVDVKVIGNVSRGDLIVTSGIPGVGIADDSSFYRRYTIGKALQSSNDERVKLIKIMIL